MSDFTFLKLIERYNEPHRYYHNFSHVAQMFEYAKKYDIELSETQNVAILLHDVVYEVDKNKLVFNGKQISNEEFSANIARDYCSVEYGDDFANKVYSIIRDTENHVPSIEDSRNVIDLDLLGLSFVEDYKINGEKIRKEFSHLSDKEFNVGRVFWLRRMLNRESIYVGRFVNSTFERDARALLQKDLREREEIS